MAACIGMNNKYDLHCVDRLSEHRVEGLIDYQGRMNAKLVQGGTTRNFEYGL